MNFSLNTKQGLLTIGGIVFILVGLLGFFNDPVLGIFEVDTPHNIVHILSGIAALAFARGGERSAKTGGQFIAVVYGLVTVLGFLMGSGQLLGLMEINMADNLLHLLFTAYFGYIGFAPLRENLRNA